MARKYFIVNPAGAVHEVTREHAALRLRQPGYRKPTAAEVAEYRSRKVQAFDDPIAPGWDPTPEAFEEPEPVEEPVKK